MESAESLFKARSRWRHDRLKSARTGRSPFRKSLVKRGRSTTTQNLNGGATMWKCGDVVKGVQLGPSAVGKTDSFQEIGSAPHRLPSLLALIVCSMVSACSSNPTTSTAMQPSPVGVSTAQPAVHVRPADLQGWAVKVAARVRPNIIFPDADKVVGNPGAQFDVRMGADGTIYSVVLLYGSGLPDWDEAALRGLWRTQSLPPDNDYMPPRVVITLRPKR